MTIIPKNNYSLLSPASFPTDILKKTSQIVLSSQSDAQGPLRPYQSHTKKFHTHLNQPQKLSDIILTWQEKPSFHSIDERYKTLQLPPVRPVIKKSPSNTGNQLHQLKLTTSHAAPSLPGLEDPLTSQGHQTCQHFQKNRTRPRGLRQIFWQAAARKHNESMWHVKRALEPLKENGATPRGSVKFNQAETSKYLAAWRSYSAPHFRDSVCNSGNRVPTWQISPH